MTYHLSVRLVKYAGDYTGIIANRKLWLIASFSRADLQEEEDGMRTTKGSPRVNIAVTEEEINLATRQDSSHCMIADAVKAAVPDAVYIAVDLQTIRFSDTSTGLRYTYLTPRTAQIALCAFDEGHSDIQPFQFQLRDAHVTRSGGAASKRVKQDNEGHTKPEKGLAQAHLMNKEGAPPRSVPLRVGGQTPPRAALASGGPRIPPAKRRSFGLRALERYGPGETLKTGTRVGNPITEAKKIPFADAP